MSELKPCPFCGSEAITTTFIDPDDFEYMPIEVNDCDAEVTCENERCINGWYLSPKAWNTRPIEDALNTRIAELEAENIRLGIEYQRMRLALGDIAINSKRALKESPNDTQKDETVYRKDKTPGIDWDKVPPVINPDELKLFKQSFDDD